MVYNLFRRKPEFPTNEALLKAITALAARNTPEAKRNYYNILLKCTLLLAQEPGASRPILLVSEDNQIVLPVFTDIDRLRKIYPDAKGVAPLPARDIFKMAVKNDIAIININPEQGPGGDLVRGEFERLADGLMPELSSEGGLSFDEQPTLVEFGSPELPSEDIIDRMLETARTMIEPELSVLESYVILTKSDTDESTLAIGLYFQPRTSPEIKTVLTRKLVPTCEAIIERRMKVLWLEDKDVNEISLNVEPFYKRTSP